MPRLALRRTNAAIVSAVLLLATLGLGQGCRKPERVADPSATPAARNEPATTPAPARNALAPARAADPSPARQDREPFRTFESKGCALSAPATWTAQAKTSNPDAKLVISSPTGEASVGIHAEAAAGKSLTKRDIAALMEKASRMPLRLEDSNWSLVDGNDAWREVRSGSLGGSYRLWIRYSYQVDKSVIQVIGTTAGNRSREDRELLETIIRSTHCRP